MCRCVEKYDGCLNVCVRMKVWCVCGEEVMEEPLTISFRHTKSHENEKALKVQTLGLTHPHCN